MSDEWESLAGKLLLAGPALEDPNFRRTVVFLCFHSPAGAFGVVLNRPLADAPLVDHLPAWAPLAAEPASLFNGGPVQPTAGIGIGHAPDGEPGDGWEPVVPGLGLLDLRLEPAAFGIRLSELRVYVGYAGWGAGQLEAELAANGWFVADRRPADLFSSQPETLWRDVLRRQRGRAAMFAYMPDDPALN